MTITDYEKIATIYQCARQGNFEGNFGKAVVLVGQHWQCRVEVKGGPTVLIRPTATGLGSWQVQFKGFIAEDADLEYAAKMALEVGAGHSATRNYRIA